ncbi:MAG: zinc protease [Cryomorphaceae bacterium]|jgi:zinc protease
MKKNLSLIATFSAVAIVGGINIAQSQAPVAPENKEAAAKDLTSAKTDYSRGKGTARKWAHEQSDIKPDAKTLYGTLDNGMRYVIHKNALPAKRVSFRLHVDAGSLSEKESQRGVAHFLEHMVFNGTKTFPDATKLVPQMQRLGIAFGAHANAYTSFDETVYMLDLPDMKKSTVDLAFNVMGDFADGALLTDAEIDEERGVISSEKTSRDSINMRMMEKQFQHLMPNSLVPNRFPIGTDEVIAKAPRAEFVDFYTRYYTPEKMTFIVVGDIDVAAMEQRVHAAFSGIKNPVEPGKPGSVGDVSGAKGFQTAVFSDKELSSTDVSLIQVRAKEKVIDSKVNRAVKLPLSIAHSIINRRFSRLAKRENATITSGSISSQVLFREAEIGSIDVTAKGGNWQAAVPVLEQELRRAVEHGFSQTEIDEITAGMINGYQQNVVRAATKKTNTIASSFAKHVHGDFVYSTPEDDLSIFQENLKTVTPDACHKALKDFWNTEDMTLVLSIPEQPENAEKSLAALYQRSKLVKVEPVAQKKVAAFGYTDFGRPGTVVSNSHIADLDVYQLEFSNGVKVNYKQTDFDKNQILISSHFGTGKLGMPQGKPGLDMLTGAVANGGGLGKHSADDLRTLLAGKNVGIGIGIGDDSFTLGGATTPEDLELQLQLFCASLTDPGFRPEAERQFKARLPMMYSQLKHSAKGAQAQMSGWLHGGDGRFTIPTLEQAQGLGTPDVVNWIKPQMLESALEIGIVGDIDTKALIPLLAKTVGALPARKPAEKVAEALRTITVPETPITKKFGFESKVPTAMAIVGWKAEDNTKHDVKLARRAGILAEVLSDRMRIKLREELGDAYSPGATTQLSGTYKNVGFVLAYSPVKPADLDNVSKVIVELGDKLAKEGASEDELKRALTPRIGMLSKSLRQNSYWLGSVVAQSQTKPYMLDWARGREADYKAINLADINALAKKYLSSDRSMLIKIAPDEVK